MKNDTVNVSHPVPPNKYGIFMMHCQDNQPFTDEEYVEIINGPIAAMEPKLQEELSKIEIIPHSDFPVKEHRGFISECKCHTKHPEECPLHGYFMK